MKAADFHKEELAEVNGVEGGWKIGKYYKNQLQQICKIGFDQQDGMWYATDMDKKWVKNPQATIEAKTVEEVLELLAKETVRTPFKFKKGDFGNWIRVEK